MIEVKKVLSYKQTGKLCTCELYADSKDDWTPEEGDPVINNISPGYELDAGSYCYTAAGDIGILDSEGTMNWIGEEEE